MTMLLHADQRPELALRVSTAFVAEIELLALTTAELTGWLDARERENPALEVERRTTEPDAPPAEPSRARPEPVAREPLATRLLRDAAPRLASADRPLAAEVLAALDDRGLLGEPVADLAARLGVPAARVDAVISALRAAGPPGLAAESASDCLLVQLATIDAPWARLAERVIRDHLADFAAGRYRAVGRALGVGADELSAVREALRAATRPYPDVDDGPPPFAPAPDVIVTERDGELSAVAAEEAGLVLRIGAAYRDAARDGDPFARDAVAAARRTIGHVRRRWATLERVAGWVVREQAAMVRGGPDRARPLTRRDVADALGLHESTVGRVVAGRRALLPDGRVIALRAFFPVAAPALAALARIVAAEAATAPRSDAELAAELARAGHPVARRTIVKYRGLLGIPAAAARGAGAA
jgi:RNA polymerase sigma-54 factor